MRDLKIAAAQFEMRSGDKEHNLRRIADLTRSAAEAGAEAVSFHECSVSGYTYARNLSREQLLDVAEIVPEGPSSGELVRIAGENRVVLLAGLFEKTRNGDLYNTYLAVDGRGLIAKYRKLHPFISRYLRPGEEYVLFDLQGWRCAISICYDNNIIENVRAVTLLGADVIFMPHVTMCTPSTRPGAGFVDPRLWENRHADPTSLRAEFDGLKGRAWLMKWLPARAYDNGVYVVFTNPIGMDDDQLKNGCSMIVDPFGDIIAECRALDEEYTIATCVYGKIERSGGHRYIQARRPELYARVLGASHTPRQNVAWLSETSEKTPAKTPKSEKSKRAGAPPPTIDPGSSG